VEWFMIHRRRTTGKVDRRRKENTRKERRQRREELRDVESTSTAAKLG